MKIDLDKLADEALAASAALVKQREAETMAAGAAAGAIDIADHTFTKNAFRDNGA